jgi:hypothetical protein
MTLEQIKQQAQTLDAVTFEKWMDDNNINYTWLDVTIGNLNDEYYNITLDDYDDEFISFYDGKYEE